MVSILKLYSYVVRWDTGFAPNPYYGYCTLACCKPAIRLRAEEGDFIVGSGSKHHGAQTKIVFGMHVDIKMTFTEYFIDTRFQQKKPGKKGTTLLGDNIYFLDEEGKYRQLENQHHHERQLKYDLKGKHVLVAEPNRFWYFGRNAPQIPGELIEIIKKGPSYKCRFSPTLVSDFLSWIQSKDTGIHGIPFDLSENIARTQNSLLRA